MADDIVTRLRDWQAEHDGTAVGIYGQAADEIERLRAELAVMTDLYLHGRVLENVKPASLSFVLDPLPGWTVVQARRG